MKIYEVEKLIEKYGEYMSLGEVLKNLKGHNIYRCPKCCGKGYTLETYNAYPAGLPDSGWVDDLKTREVKCDLCNAKGYTDKEYKPRYKTELIGYERKANK